MSNFITLLAITSIVFLINNSTTHSHNSIDRSLLRIRNQYLRFYFYNKKSNIKSCLLATSDCIKDRTTQIYNKMLSKYYDIHTAYYSLPDEDREIIEQIIGLHF
jgi:hypothetical protein